MRLFNKGPAASLHRTYSPEGIMFSYDGNNPPEFPLNTNDADVLSDLFSQGAWWAALDELWAEGLLDTKSGGEWTVPYRIYENTESDEDVDILRALDLPLPKALGIVARSFSSVAEKNFNIAVEATDPEHGPLREGDPPRFGSVFYIGEDTIVPMTRSQKDLFEAARKRDTDFDTIEGRMAYLAETKEAAIEAGAVLDGYLGSEDYCFRTEAKLDIEEDTLDELRLIPVVEGLDDFGVSSDVLLGDQPPSVLTKTGSGGKRSRMVIGKELQERLSKLPPGGTFQGADVPRILTNPEQLLPEGFDLSLFSERVKGIKTKVYDSRPYIHVNRLSGGWFEAIPGIELDDASPGESADDLSGSFSREQGNLSPETYRELVDRARETGEEYVQHEGAWIRIDVEDGDRFGQALGGCEPQEDGTFRIPAGSALEIYENLDCLDFIDPATRALESDQLPEDLPDLPLPATFNGQVYPFQLTGYRWLSRLSTNHIGGLLADEMGLGKTVQTIAHFLRLKEEGQQDPSLVVVPKTLIQNWQREIAHFSDGSLKVYTYDGPGRRYNPALFSEMDVILTTYDTLRRDQATLGTVDWGVVVCDEAQYVKNPTTQRTSAIKAMKGKHRIALTGTPVENGLIEFWCIMDFVQPGLLGSWADFRRRYERPIVEGDEEERESKVESLLGEINGYYLRRLKADYLTHLPQKVPEYHEVSLGDRQFEIYREIAQMGKAGGKGAALAAITKLLMLSAHPLAIQGSNVTDEEVSKVDCPKLDKTLSIISGIRDRSEKVISF